MRIFYGPLLAWLVTCAPAQAQVIEIDSSGESRTYAGPTVFTEAGGDLIRGEEREGKKSSVATADMLAQAALAQGVDPRLLQAVAWQESRGRMNAVSYKGALGVMQLMPGTAAALGVDPTNLADNLRGGAMYLRQQLDRFGSVPLALAAYNAGPGAVMRYRGVPPYRETRDYVTKIMKRWAPIAPIVAAAQPLPPITESSIIEVPE